jgi:hypothetical protein
MAFRLQLAPQTVGLLSSCQAAVRERILSELGEVFSGPLLRAGKQVSENTTGGDFTLPSGFHVRYALDRGHGLLHLLELRAPGDDTVGVQAF